MIGYFRDKPYNISLIIAITTVSINATYARFSISEHKFQLIGELANIKNLEKEVSVI